MVRRDFTEEDASVLWTASRAGRVHLAHALEQRGLSDPEDSLADAARLMVVIETVVEEAYRTVSLESGRGDDGEDQA